MPVVVCDASPLVNLSAIGRLQLLRRLFGIVLFRPLSGVKLSKPDRDALVSGSCKLHKKKVGFGL